jgi:IS5 family transposase
MSKDKYKVRNWQQYNEGLKQRGSLNLWISADIVLQWKHQQQGIKRRGGQCQYSSLAVELCLMLRKVYNLPLRQTEGFVRSIFSQAAIKLSVPDYTTLCRRSKGLKANLSNIKKTGAIDIAVDSTGLKVYGEGEWKVRKHGAGKHRTWMKLHIAVNVENQQIKAVTLTTNAVDDASQAEPLLEQIGRPVNSCAGDGGYDKDKFRKALHKHNIRQVIPPQHNAVLDKTKRAHRKERDEAINTIAAEGRIAWKKQQNYHQRSKAETVMFRYKTIIGGTLRARKTEHQQTEVVIGCKILNIMLQTAKPESVKVA